MAYSSKWEMTILEIQTRDIHTPTPTPPPPYTCPTLRQTYAWLCLISHCIFCSLFIYFCAEFSWQYHAMHKFFRALDNPPPLHPRADLSSLTVLKTISWSHNEAQKSYGKQINKPMEYTYWIFSFYLEKVIFMNQLCRNPQFSGIFISICHIWSSCWHDKC